MAEQQAEQATRAATAPPRRAARDRGSAAWPRNPDDDGDDDDDGDKDYGCIDDGRVDGDDVDDGDGDENDVVIEDDFLLWTTTTTTTMIMSPEDPILKNQSYDWSQIFSVRLKTVNLKAKKQTSRSI